MKNSLINLAFLSTGAAAFFFLFMACLFTSLWLMAPAVALGAICNRLADKSTIGREDA